MWQQISMDPLAVACVDAADAAAHYSDDDVKIGDYIPFWLELFRVSVYVWVSVDGIDRYVDSHALRDNQTVDGDRLGRQSVQPI